MGKRWMPLEDSEIDAFVYVDKGGKQLGVFAGDDYPDWYATAELPDNIRLCRLEDAPSCVSLTPELVAALNVAIDSLFDDEDIMVEAQAAREVLQQMLSEITGGQGDGEQP